MLLQDLKDFLKLSVKGTYYKIITDDYPITEQLNLIRSGGDAAMDAFIDGKRADEDAISTEVDALADTSIYDDFTVGSDADMKNFVSSKMTLSNDEQKVSVIKAIQAAKLAFKE